MAFWVYMLRCADGSYYTGQTEALEQRIAQHHEGAIPGCYTEPRRPLTLVFSQDFPTREEALVAERRIKGWRREKKEALVERRFERLPALARTARPRSAADADAAGSGLAGSPLTGSVVDGTAGRGSTGSPRTGDAGGLVEASGPVGAPRSGRVAGEAAGRGPTAASRVGDVPGQTARAGSALSVLSARSRDVPRSPAGSVRPEPVEGRPVPPGLSIDDLLPPLREPPPASAEPEAPFSADDLHWMRHALTLADRAEHEFDEVPVGAVLVDAQGHLLAEGCNRTIGLHDPTAHAEIVALRAAGESLANYRFPGTTLYVTLEPCAMCAMALVHARVARVVYAARDPKTGAAGSVFDLLGSDRHNHRVRIDAGLLGDEAGPRLTRYFRRKRGKPD